MPDRDRDPIDVAADAIESALRAFEGAEYYGDGERVFRELVRAALTTLVAATKTPAEERVLAAMAVALQDEIEDEDAARAELGAAMAEYRIALRAEREGGGGGE